jgi:hypothetical protein
MKNNIKALQLIEKGLSAKTVSKLTESQISILHSKLVREEIKKTVTNVTYDPSNVTDQQKLAQVGVHVDPSSKKITMSQSGGAITTEDEMTENEIDDVTDDNALGKDAMQNYTGQDSPHDADDMAPDGMDDDSDNDRKMMGMSEENEKNPWAICTSQLGKEFKTTERSQWSSKQKAKYERCVKDVKKSLKEEKNKVSLFIESQIMKIVEKNIPPRITKGDLVKFLSEQKPAVAPSKPAPTTKPGKPAPKPNVRPSHPGKNPNPNVKPAPKAISPEKAKDQVIDLIMKLLEQ